MAETLTLMAVHAHPDDEASSTGGVLAKYADEGVRTILITCTNGEFGDGPAASNRDRTVMTRRPSPRPGWRSYGNRPRSSA